MTDKDIERLAVLFFASISEQVTCRTFDECLTTWDERIPDEEREDWTAACRQFINQSRLELREPLESTNESNALPKESKP